MSNRFKVVSVRVGAEFFGVAVDFDGNVSFSRGPFTNRRAAREAAIDAVEALPGGEVIKRVRIGKEIGSLQGHLLSPA